MQFGSIPALLIALAHWVDWRYEERDGKRTKIPYCAATGLRASTTDPSTWSVYESAAAAAPRYDGIGFVFSKEDDLVGVDLDDCRDPETAEIAEWALAIVRSLNSYTEITPSGRGLHILCRGKLPPGGRRKGKIEIYEDGRYFTITGDRLREGSDAIEERQGELTALHSSLFPPPSPTPRPNGVGVHSSPRADWEIVDQVRKNPRFDSLWRGDFSVYPSHSEADLALVGCIAFFAGPDRATVDRIFRQSGMWRGKWDEQHGSETYGSLTLNTALLGKTEFYSWPPARIEVKERTQDEASFASFALSSLARENIQAPTSLEPEALHGLPGEIVAAIDPHTESHPAAVLASLVTGIGCLTGSGPAVYRDAGRQTANEFACLVGLSAKGRKGTATRRVDEILNCLSDSEETGDLSERSEERGCMSHESLFESLRLSGLGSGEAMVEALAEEGTDRRRMIVEEEFSRCLKVMRRDGSTLSETLRQAWDGSTLSNRTKGKHLRAYQPHVSILGHITEAEMKAELGGAALYNGFANRFLWICCSRSKSLPLGGGHPETAKLVLRLQETLLFSRRARFMEFDADAQSIWTPKGGIYDRLIDRPTGLLGAVTSRAEAHVTRLSLFYALMDLEREIKVPHLLAALALWDFSERSCAYLFGHSTGDDAADKIEEALIEAHPGGLARVELWALFQRHVKAGTISGGLELLSKLGKAEVRKVKTPGRSSEIWSWKGVGERGLSERSELSPLNRARVMARELGYATEATKATEG